MFVVNSALLLQPAVTSPCPFTSRPPTSLITLANPFSTANGIVPPAAVEYAEPGFQTGVCAAVELSRSEREVERRGCFHSGLCRVERNGSAAFARCESAGNSPGAAPLATRSPYPAFSNILVTESGGNSEYESLQLSFKRRLASGLTMLTLRIRGRSRSMIRPAFLPTSASIQNFPQNSHNYRLERALSSFDVPNLATVALVWAVPGSNRWARGFELSSIVTAESGQPFTPELSSDNSNTGNSGGNFGIDRPNVVGNPSISNPSPQEWFNVNAFAIPAQYTWGNAGRNILRGPGLFTMDLSLRRTFALRERLRMTVEAQSFNTLNRANFNQPDAFADQPLTFGKIFSAKPPRQIQFALRFAF